MSRITDTTAYRYPNELWILAGTFLLVLLVIAITATATFCLSFIFIYLNFKFRGIYFMIIIKVGKTNYYIFQSNYP